MANSKKTEAILDSFEKSGDRWMQHIAWRHRFEKRIGVFEELKRYYREEDSEKAQPLSETALLVKKYIERVFKFEKLKYSYEGNKKKMTERRRIKEKLEREEQQLFNIHKILETQNIKLEHNKTEFEYENTLFRRMYQKQERLNKERAVLVMLQKGIDTETITNVFEITTEDIEAIQEKYKDEEVLEALLNGHLKK